MPHAHILFRPWNADQYEERMKNGYFEWIDSLISAELPEPDDLDYLRRFKMIDGNGWVVPEI
eukprot:1574576-Rhodomonas_salina.1